MRTTVTFDKDVAAAVRELQRTRSIGVSEAVNELVRQGLMATPRRWRYSRGRAIADARRREHSPVRERYVESVLRASIGVAEHPADRPTEGGAAVGVARGIPASEHACPARATTALA